MRYIPHTKDDIERMLRVIGVSSVAELFAEIPQPLRFEGKLDLPAPLCEADMLEHLRELGAANEPQSRGTGTLVFAGAGCHPHAIPSAVSMLSGRSEFYTAYTPYQPELSQGTLLAIFEYQTMVAELLGMQVANASMYDGASAAAEGVLMARRLTGRQRVLIARSLHPAYQRTARTYLAGQGGREAIEMIPFGEEGALDLAALTRQLNGEVAAIVVQSPNFFGVLEDYEPICEAAAQHGALVVAVCTEPLALALTRPPGDAGVDIAVAEGIGLAGPPSLGGPGVGLFAVRDTKTARAMPGRVVGQTVDHEGKPGYVLTLATREQHIRREKATSNICSNQGLMALRFTMHLALLGKTGFTELAQLNLAKAHFARDLLGGLDGFQPRFSAPFFNELAIQTPEADAAALVKRAAAKGVVPGVALGRFYPEFKDTLLVAVNETHRREDIERLAEALKSSVQA